jgi:hypothetical protein
MVPSKVTAPAVVSVEAAVVSVEAAVVSVEAAVVSVEAAVVSVEATVVAVVVDPHPAAKATSPIRPRAKPNRHTTSILLFLTVPPHSHSELMRSYI